MDAALVVDWSREALRVAILLGGPALLAALAVGIIVGIGQTLTQMHEPVIGLVPRVLAVLLIMLIALPWLISVWVDFARSMIGGIPDLLTASVDLISRIA
jgi:flagellar biosynthesis protein FliQ